MTSSRKDDLKAFITMTTEGLKWQAENEGTQDAKMVAKLAEWTEELAQLEAKGIDLPGMVNVTDGLGTPRALTDRPAAGSRASNQYGDFQVHYATERQTRFIKGLLEQKDLTKLNDSSIRTTLDVDALRQQVSTNTVNKKAASDIIDRLLGLPNLPGEGAVPARQGKPLATDKQMGFLAKLIEERDYYSLVPADREKVDYIKGGGRPTAAGASALIEVLLVTAKDERQFTPKQAVEAGVYTNDATGVTYRVYLGQQSGQMLAAKVVELDEVDADGKRKAEFVYEGKADRFITAAFRKLTIEEAARFGKSTGTCIVCARRLDVPESVDRGIGPVCFAKMGGTQ